MLTKYEQFALDQVFHSYPERLKNYAEILGLCMDDNAREAFNAGLEDTEDEDQQFWVCEAYETYRWEWLPGILNELRDSAIRAFKENPKCDYITVKWHIEDVQQIRPDLTAIQAREVLEQVKKQHDCTIGINWEVIGAVSDSLFGEPKNDSKTSL